MASGESPMSELYLGLISGTSLDAVDAALVDFAAHPPRPVVFHSHPFPADLRAALLALCHGGGGDELRRMAQLDVQVGKLFGDAALAVLNRAAVAPETVRAIGSHGQTVRHEPASDPPFTVQIGDPNHIAQRTGITTVADFRRRDVAAGGQGAPLVPAFHAALLRVSDEDRVVLNIGGMANITVLPREPRHAVGGFDTGPGNVLMDGWAQRHLDTARDENGRWAATAEPDAQLLAALLDDAYFKRPPPKSTGREYFNMRWLESHLKRSSAAAPATVQASLCALTAMSAAHDITRYAPATKRVLVCGGGIHNATLMQRLATELSGITVESTQTLGLDPDWIEALAFAWLAKQTLDGHAGNLPAVTGASAAVVLGGIYPGRTK